MCVFVICPLAICFVIYVDSSGHADFEKFSQQNNQEITQNWLIFDQKPSLFQNHSVESSKCPIFVFAPKTQQSGAIDAGGRIFFPYGTFFFLPYP